MLPKKGAVVLVPFPFTDLSGQKVRPALVISELTDENDIIVVFISSKVPKKILNIDLKINQDKENNLKAPSLVKCSKIATLDTKIILGELGFFNKQQMERVDEKLKTILGL